METDDTLDISAKVLLQASETAGKDYQRAQSYSIRDRESSYSLSSNVSSDCTSDASIHHQGDCSEQGNVLQCVKTEDQLAEVLQDGRVLPLDTIYNQQTHCSDVNTSLTCEKSEDQHAETLLQEGSRQLDVTCDAGQRSHEFIDPIVNVKIMPDDYRSDKGDETRRWIVCEGGLLKEVSDKTAESSDQTEARRDTSYVEVNKTLATVMPLGGTPFARSKCVKYRNIAPAIVKMYTHSSSGNPPTTSLDSLRATRPKPYICSTCGKTYCQPGRLKAHENTHTGPWKPQTHTCTTCGKSFAKSFRLKTHEMTHTGLKPYSCSICGKKFTQSGKLKCHEVTHTGLKPFTCPVCGKAFTYSYNLKVHRVIHTGLKPYSCSICGKSFTQPTTRNAHVKTHSTVKPYVCCTCGKAFGTPYTLKVHQVVHSGVKAFSCSTCGKCFSQSSTRNAHERIHSGTKTYLCVTCGKLFIDSSCLRKHEKIHICLK